MTNLVNLAAGLLDRTFQPEDNPEYFRALYELVGEAYGFRQDDLPILRDMILERAHDA